MITDLLQRNAATFGEREFIVTDTATYDFATVNAAALSFCGRLQSLGICEGDHVALVAGNSASYLVAWFGINLAGAVAVTLNTQLIGEGLIYVVAQSDSKIVVADRPWITTHGIDEGGPAFGLPLITIDDASTFAQTGEAGAIPARLAPGAPATIMYTSGTTGLPKGVLSSHAAYLAGGSHMVSALRLTQADRCMVVLPLFHANPQIYAVLPALLVGSTLVIRERFSASSFFEDARRFRATGFTYVGTILAILAVRHETDHNHALRFCTGGGAPLKVWREVENRFRVRVHELYGMTETGAFVCVNTAEEMRLGSCGRIRSDMDVRIVDTEDTELPAGEAGEIVVRPRAPGIILSGYYKQPEKMMEACRNLWFHTGDRGHIDADGFLYFHGRDKELIRRGGEMLSPAELEATLRHMPGVVDCAVVGIDDDVMGQEIKIVAVIDPAAHPAPSDIVAFLAARLPSFMLPRYVEFAESIPKTETEKVQRQKIAYVDERVHDLRS